MVARGLRFDLRNEIVGFVLILHLRELIEIVMVRLDSFMSLTFGN